MIRGLSCCCQQLALPVADHLWQSTVFALLAACLTLLLKRNPARLRFNVWFMASLKFLLPFAVLVRLGHVFGAKVTGSPPKNFVFVVELAGQPFSRTPAHLLYSTWRERLPGVIPALLAAIWIVGAAGVLALWWRRWLQVSRARKAAQPLSCGVEVELMRSLAPAFGIKPMPILLLASRLEPGIFGVLRPVLFWPAGISEELQESQLKAILAHELWHARRRDNLMAALQMSIEAVFWFHPLVWWLGLRQMDERELACDEGVLGLGGEPAAYAEGILKACRFCVESPLPCVAGVNGSNLNRRIKRIMKRQVITALSTSRKLIFSSLAIATTAVIGAASYPQAAAQAAAPAISSGPVRVTTLKRTTSGPTSMTLIKHTADGTSISNMTVRGMIELAYSMKDYQLTGGPSWINQDRFDLSFTGGEPSGKSQMVSSPALKEILSQQFHLVLRQETQPGPVFALVVGDGGAKFAPITPPNAPGTNELLISIRVLKKDGQGQIAITGGPGGLADTLSQQVGRPVFDNTGLIGIFSIHFHWATASAAASISADLQQQLGLSLVPQQGPVEASVIDSVTVPAGS